jgi:hypothetical protein
MPRTIFVEINKHRWKSISNLNKPLDLEGHFMAISLPKNLNLQLKNRTSLLPTGKLNISQEETKIPMPWSLKQWSSKKMSKLQPHNQFQLNTINWRELRIEAGSKYQATQGDTNGYSQCHHGCRCNAKDVRLSGIEKVRSRLVSRLVS